MKELEAAFLGWAKSTGVGDVAAEAKYHRLRAEVLLERAKGD